jgi:hypothetical protein
MYLASPRTSFSWASSNLQVRTGFTDEARTDSCVTVRNMYAATAVSAKGQFQGAVTRAAPRADRQLVYIESYSSSLPSSSSLLILVSLIVAIYKAPFFE